jgi:hypothetical protein
LDAAVVVALDTAVVVATVFSILAIPVMIDKTPPTMQ